MYNIVKFIVKYHFVFLFFFLELLALILLFNNNKYQKVKFLNTSNVFTGSIYSAQANIKNYFSLKEINEQLSAENAALKNQMSKVQYIEVPTLYHDTVYKTDSLIIDTTRQSSFLSAKVISNSVNKQLNVIYINKGTRDGFYVNMGMVNIDGVVGVVRTISNNYATITPIINTEFNINAKIKNSGFFGNLTWDGKNPIYAQLSDIPNHISPSVGDTIVTSGYSHIFSEGFIIGYIDQVNSIPGKSFININVKLAVEFGNLNYLYGLENSVKPTIDSLKNEL